MLEKSWFPPTSRIQTNQRVVIFSGNVPKRNLTFIGEVFHFYFIIYSGLGERLFFFFLGFEARHFFW